MQKIILLEDVEKLGRRGRVITVKDGFALNFIIPRGLGLRATDINLKRLDGLRKRFVVEEKERQEKAKGLLERLTGQSVTIAMKASEEGHLYGSVQGPMIADSLKEGGFDVEPKAIKLVEPIKEIGVYNVPIQLHDDVRAEIKVWVVEEKEASAETTGTVDAGSEDAAAAGEEATSSAAAETTEPSDS